MASTSEGLRELFATSGLMLMTAEVHSGLRVADELPEEEIRDRVEHAKMLAELTIEYAGFDLSDSDRRGNEMGGAVKDLLAVAILLIGPDEYMSGVIL